MPKSWKPVAALLAALTMLFTAAGLGGAQRQPDSTRFEDSEGPSWSADGHTIAFHRLSSTIESIDENGIWLMSADGRHQRRLTNSSSGDGLPAWSPDGGRIAFTRYRTIAGRLQPELYVMDVNGSDQRLVTASGFDPSWSPDGRRIAFSVGARGRDISVVNADGSGETNLTNSEALDTTPDWSAAGRIAFASDRGSTTDNEDFNLYVMGPDGSGLTRLTQSPDWEIDPNWSPDGKRLVYTVATPPTDPRNLRRLYVMNADGSASRKLTSGPFDQEPDWSPDGKKIVFVRGRPTIGYDIYVINPDGTGLRRLTFSHAAAADGERCTITGTDGKDVLVGTPGRDVICSFGGNDVVRAGGGDDVIDGGPGTDLLSGGAGRDTILARDGEPDRIDGGGGRDRAVVDKGLDRVRRVEARSLVIER